MSRAARSPSAASKAATIAAGTVSRAIMLAWAETCSPVASPAHGMQSAPVWTATRPAASTIATWRTAASASEPSRASSAPAAVVPAARRSSPCGPWAGSTTDCVATAPTPGRAQVQSEPTENQCECTAAPCSPLSGSKATIE